MILLVGTFLLLVLLVAVPVLWVSHRRSNGLSESVAESALQLQQLIEANNVEDLGGAFFERNREIRNRIERIREFDAHTAGEKRLMDMLSAEETISVEARSVSRFDNQNANEESRDAIKKVRERLVQCNLDVREAIRARLAESSGQCTVPPEYNQ